MRSGGPLFRPVLASAGHQELESKSNGLNAFECQTARTRPTRCRAANTLMAHRLAPEIESKIEITRSAYAARGPSAERKGTSALLTQHLPLQRAFHPSTRKPRVLGTPALRALGHAGLPLFRACGASALKFPQFRRFHLSRKAGTKMISSFSAQGAPSEPYRATFIRPA
jgi:hypothetical protein